MPGSRECVIGIDGGASSTRAAIIDRDLEVIAQGLGGPADHYSPQGGKERLRVSLEEALAPLLVRLSEEPAVRLRAVSLGLTGVSIPGKRDAALEILGAIFPKVPVIVISDTITAWAGAHAGQDGVVVISGTGSVAYGRQGGAEFRAGGFGYLLGDEGSGFRISLSAIGAALRSSDGTGPPTTLAGVIAAFFGVDSIRRLPGKIYAEDIPVDYIASLCPSVVAEAYRGDVEAKRVLSEAGRDLGRLAVATLIALGGGARRVSYAGGVFRSGDVLLGPFRDYIISQAPQAEVVPPAYSPLIGAGILAWKHLSEGGSRN